MANFLRNGNPIRVGLLASDPSSPVNGLIYYNTTTNKLRSYVDGSWSDVSTGTVSLIGQALNQNNAIVGSGSNLSAAVDTSSVGDILADSTNGLTIKSGVIVNADINASAAIALSKLAALTATRVVVTDGSGVITVASYAPTDLLLKDGSVTLTGNLDLGSNKLVNVADPTAAQDGATKAYVDAVAQGLKPKTAARVATTANISIATDLENGDSIDGITLVTGDRVLVKDQSTASQNGIYIVAASGAASRSTDFDSLSPIDEINGAMVAVQEGSTNAGKVYVQQGTVATIGTDPINFVFFNSVASIIGGDMITVSGQTVSVDLATVSGLESTNPGNNAGQLRVKVEASTPSLEIDGSNQLKAKYDNSTIESSASGLRVKDGGITDAKVATGIDAAKIGAGSVSNTEFGYLDGVTSAIQTQLGNKASTALDNLASTAVNTDLLPSANNTRDIGNDSNEWKDVYTHSVTHNDATNPDLLIHTAGNNGSIVVEAHGTGKLDVKADKVRRSEGATSTNFVEEEYIDAITLTASQTNAVASALTFAHASFEGVIIQYKIKEATTNRVRVGTLYVATNGTTNAISDLGPETDDVGVTWDVQINGANVELLYTTTANNKTMRADVKRIRA